MTPSILNGITAAEKLRKKYPDRQIAVIDTTCSSSGYGMLVDDAADLRDAGKGMDEIVDWVNRNCRRLHLSCPRPPRSRRLADRNGTDHRLYGEGECGVHDSDPVRRQHKFCDGRKTPSSAQRRKWSSMRKTEEATIGNAGSVIPIVCQWHYRCSRFSRIVSRI